MLPRPAGGIGCLLPPRPARGSRRPDAAHALPGDRAASMLPRPAGDRPPRCCHALPVIGCLLLPRPAGDRPPRCCHALPGDRLPAAGHALPVIRSAPAMQRSAATPPRCAAHPPRASPCSNPTGCSYPAPAPCPAPPTPQPLWGSPALRTPRALHPRRNPYGVAAPAPCAPCIMRPASPHVATLRVALILRLRHGPHPGSARLPRPPHALRPQSHALRDSLVSIRYCRSKRARAVAPSPDFR